MVVGEGSVEKKRQLRILTSAMRRPKMHGTAARCVAATTSCCTIEDLDDLPCRPSMHALSEV